MRCFQVNDSQVSRGFPVTNTSGIVVGEKEVPFGESLLHSQIGHFHQFIVNCKVVHQIADDDRVFLTAAENNSWTGDNAAALVHVEQYVDNDGEHSIYTDGAGRLHVTGIKHKYLFDDSIEGYDSYWCGLVELDAGATLIIEDEAIVSDLRSLWQFISGRASEKKRVVTRTSITFDGHNVKVNSRRQETRIIRRV